VTIDQVNQMTKAEFVEKAGWVFEHSPWVAERAWGHFSDLAAMHQALCDQVRDASRDEQLALLRAHPDLGTRARMSNSSTGEQAGAGLDRLTPDEFQRLQSANQIYKDKFGFPFLFAVKGSTKYDILEAIERRVNSSWDDEFATALEQVFRIATFRLQDLLT
jgi:2-oxo-4-hydroxy-4-carboxy-5-ureidoimidazoline decarboxylase